MRKNCCYGQKNFGSISSSLSPSPTHLSHTTNINPFEDNVWEKCVRSFIEVRHHCWLCFRMYMYMYVAIQHTSLSDEPRPERSSDLNQDALRELAKFNPCKSTWKLALDTSQYTIYHYLKKIWKASKLGVLYSDTLGEKDKEEHISIVTSLLSRQRNDRFSKISLQVTKSGSFMTMFNAKVNRLTRMNPRSQF